MKKCKKILLTIAVMVFCFGVMSLTASAASTDTGRENAYAGSSHPVFLSTSWAAARFAFTPTTTGYYTFYSDRAYYGNVGDPYFYLTTSSYPNTVGNALASAGCKNETSRNYSYTYNDDSRGNADFYATYLCYAGQTYYLFATKYSNVQTNYMFYVSGPSYYYIGLNRNGGSGGSAYYYNYGGTAWLYSNSGSATSYVTPPTRSNYTFVGYYNTSAASGGTQYIASNGAIINGGSNIGSQTLYARWQQNVYTLTFNNQGVANNTKIVGSGDYIPSSVSDIAPKRTGYTFEGYYDAASGGTQYYNSACSRVYNVTMTASKTLYAHWKAQTYSVSYAGLDGATISGNPSNHTYGTNTTIPDPTKTDYTFMGWSVNGGSSLVKNLVLNSTGYVANVTLTANWKKTTDALVEDSAALITSNTISREDLLTIFNHPVADTDGTKGVTTYELNNSASIVLKLVISNGDASADGESAIKETTNGEVVKFFDVKIIKEVTPLNDGEVVTTTLTEVPETITIHIPLTGDLASKSSYQVLRYHVEEASAKGPASASTNIFATDDAAGGEYSTVIKNEDGSQTLEIHTRMFSTYAVAAGERSLDMQDSQEVSGATGSEVGIDVQGKISQEDIKATYKLDIGWGPMVFEYTTSSTWDPYNHEYVDPNYSWSDNSFQNGNNEITVKNHSNADVNVNFTFAREQNQLEGVDVAFKATNADTAEAVNEYALAKVSAEGAEAPEIKSYLWLSGSPKDLPADAPSGGESDLAKVGVITVTATPDAFSTLTPKSTVSNPETNE